MKRFLCILTALAAIALIPSPARAQVGNEKCGWTSIRIINGTITFPTDRQNCFQITLTENVTSSSLFFPFHGEWVYITTIQDATGGRTFTPPPQTLNWQPIDSRPFDNTPGSTAGVTTEMGYWDGTYLQIIGAYLGGAGGCSDGASDTRYVDSIAGSDSNTGLNWCAAKLTEQAGITALGAGGGWLYVAPNYTGAAATGVPANVHILETNQFDAVSPSVRRYSFPDWTDDSQNALASLSMMTATPTSTTTALAQAHAFGEDFENSAVTGSTLIPSYSASFNNAIGVLGLADVQGRQTQSQGVQGICYSEFDATDCTGVTGLAIASTAANNTTSLEGGWFQVWPKSTVNNVDGVVVRGTTTNMPLTDAGPNLPTAALDVRGSGTLEQTWLHGLYMEDWTVWQPIYLGLQKNPDTSTVPDRGNNGILFAWQYDVSVEETSQFRVTGSTSALYPFGGDFQFVNNHANGTASVATVTVQTNATGNVSVDALHVVTFTGTDAFDRSLGKIQKITLTANESASTLQNCVAGQTLIFDVIEDATGGWTFSPPANLHGFGSITTTANFHNRQAFYCDGSSSNSGGYSTSSMQSGT
jgi:hypothetical protein